MTELSIYVPQSFDFKDSVFYSRDGKDKNLLNPIRIVNNKNIYWVSFDVFFYLEAIVLDKKCKHSSYSYSNWIEKLNEMYWERNRQSKTKIHNFPNFAKASNTYQLSTYITVYSNFSLAILALSRGLVSLVSLPWIVFSRHVLQAAHIFIHSTMLYWQKYLLTRIPETSHISKSVN